jgi:uncharacterized protein DUF3761
MRLTRLVLSALTFVVCAAAPARSQGIRIPDNATVQCNDGSWGMTASRRGACSGHKGVKHWVGARPRNAAARCNDGEYWTNATMQGACSRHGGVFQSYKEAKADVKAERKEAKAEVKADRKEMKAEMKAEKRRP